MHPNGNPTDGITRTYTDVVSFAATGEEKFSSAGGVDNWDPTQYGVKGGKVPGNPLLLE